MTVISSLELMMGMNNSFIYILLNRTQVTKRNKHTDIKTEIKPNFKKSWNQPVHKLVIKHAV